MHSTRSPLILLALGPTEDAPQIARVLSDADYRVAAAAGTGQALALAQDHPPDLALLDIVAPGIGGIELCRRLHELPGLAELPVMFVASAPHPRQLLEAFDAGAVDYVTRPFLDEELLVRVRTHVELKRARDRLGEMLNERKEVTEVVAHDIKNPLSSILFGAQMLLQSKQTPIPREEVIRDIRLCAEQALRLIEDFLTRGLDPQRLHRFRAQRNRLEELTPPEAIGRDGL